MNLLEAVMAGLLTETKPSFVWVTECGEAKRAVVRLLAALLVIGGIVGVLDNASPAGLPVAGEAKAALFIR